MRILDVEFMQKVKFPTGTSGNGRNMTKLNVAHPESPWTDHVMTWSFDTDELVVTHVKSGVTCGVPRANIAWMRPSLKELVDAAAKTAKAK